jgi:tetrahedral aminopeptidase
MDKVEIGRMLRRLTQVDGLSGAEERVGAVVRELAQPYAAEVRTSRLGSIIAYKPGTVNRNLPATEASAAADASGPAPCRIMLAAHMDEIGLIVTRVEGSFLHVSRVGGPDPRNLLAQEVRVYPTGPGSDQYPDGLPGYIGSRPPHVLSDQERSRVVPFDALRVDLGTPSLGNTVRIGDRIAVCGAYTELLGGRVASKALDDRAGVAAMLGALGYLGGMQHTWDVYAVATIQEEVGEMGAATVTFGVAPDVAIALDVTFGDTPGLDDTETVEMDKGPVIAWGPNMHPGLVKKLREVADDIELGYVSEPVAGGTGTDAWAIQVSRQGVPTALVEIAVRYMHSATELVVLADVDRTARLLAAFISRLDADFLTHLPEEV